MKKPVELDFANEQATQDLFNEAFQHPHRKYVVQPVDVKIAEEWLKGNTNTVNFVWCAGVKSFKQRLQEGGAFHPRQLIHLDTLFYRDRCGWAAGSYHCDYPYAHGDEEFCGEEGCEECEELGTDEQGDARRKRLCFSTSCPIASAAYPDDIKKLDPDLYRSDYKQAEDESTDWMILHSRPRYAYVPNVVVLGCEEIYEKMN